MPSGIADAPAVSHESSIFLFGGYGERSDDVKNHVLEYVPSEDTWSFRTPMRKARWGAAAALHDGHVFIFGGAVGGTTIFAGWPPHRLHRRLSTTRVVERYDIARDNWATLKSLPARLNAFGLMAAIVGPKIYLFNEAFTFEYDTINDTYKRRADAPVVRRWGTCACVKVGNEDRIYIIAGYDSKARDASDANYYYLPNSDEWVGPRTAAPYHAMGVTRDNPVWQNRIYFGFGHRKPDLFYKDLYSYDPKADSWTGPFSGSLFERDGVGCAVADKGLYVIGGRSEPNDALAFGLIHNERFELGDSRDEES